MAPKEAVLSKSTAGYRTAAVIFVSVGTFIHGFDELIIAADRSARGLALEGMAQIGHSRAIPQHLDWQRYFEASEMQHWIERADLVICHGGVGIIGDAMRAGTPILAVPRRGPTTSKNPANDQTEFVEQMVERFGISVCVDLGQLEAHLAQLLPCLPATVDYSLGSDVPKILADYLGATETKGRGLF